MSKVLTFSIKKFQFTPIDNKQFVGADFWAIRDSLNRNESSFTPESLEDAKPTVINKPILANFIQNDFGSHDVFPRYDPISGKMYEQYIEKPIGVINESSNVRIEKQDGHNWLCFSGLIWKEYSFLETNLLKKRRTNKISVEINVISSYYDENNIEIIEKFELLGVTLLGININEGIPNAHLDLIDFNSSEVFSEYRKALCFAYDKEGDNMNAKNIFIAKEKIGSKPALKVNTSKEAMSTSPWGKENKSKLKKECLMASNYVSVCPKVFLKLGENWKDGIEGDLGYPVMEKKGDTLVYNRYGIASAEAYATKNNEAEVLRKIKIIKKKLGLDDNSKKEELEKMAKNFNSQNKEYIYFGQNEKYVFFVKKAENKIYAHPFSEDLEAEEFEEEKLMEMEVKAEMSGEEMDMEEIMCKFVEEPADDGDEDDTKKFEDEKKEYEDKLSKLEEEKKNMEEKITKLEEEKKDMEEKITKAEDDKKEYEGKIEMKEKELEEVRMSEFTKEFNTLMAEEEDMEENFKKKLEEDKASNKFSNIEDVKKEIAYDKYKKEEEVRATKKSSFKMNINHNKPTGTKNLFDEISESVKKCK